MRVLLVDDHTLVRAGIKAFLQTQTGVEVIGEAANGVEAVKLAGSLRPDVIVMDITMPEKNGIDATREIHAQHPEIKVIIVTSSDSPEHVFAALQSGATGYCIKNIDDERLLAGIKAVSLGDVWMDAGVAKTLARAVPHPTVVGAGTKSGAGGGEHYHLTERELEVLRCLTDGLSNQDIAKKLFVSKETVKTTVTHILDKMKASSRTEAAAKALRSNII